MRNKNLTKSSASTCQEPVQHPSIFHLAPTPRPSHPPSPGRLVQLTGSPLRPAAGPPPCDTAAAAGGPGAASFPHRQSSAAGAPAPNPRSANRRRAARPGSGTVRARARAARGEREEERCGERNEEWEGRSTRLCSGTLHVVTGSCFTPIPGRPFHRDTSGSSQAEISSAKMSFEDTNLLSRGSVLERSARGLRGGQAERGRPGAAQLVEK